MGVLSDECTRFTIHFRIGKVTKVMIGTARTRRRLASSMARMALWSCLVCVVVLGGCRERPAVADPPGDVSAEAREPVPEQPAVLTQPVPQASPPVDGCIKGGTTRAEVRALLGEPDSISWGVWLYGESEITFGYGVVVAFADVEDNLMLC